jgi:hypothetical protein
MQRKQIICDACGADITTGKDRRDLHYVELITRMKDRPTGLSPQISLEIVDPPLERDHQFCNLRCLAAWLARIPTPAKPDPNA